MSTVVSKQETKKIVVGFDHAGCTHALKGAGGIFCYTLDGSGKNPHVNCDETAETCEAVWDQDADSWVWMDSNPE